jgi:hypothetical protein
MNTARKTREVTLSNVAETGSFSYPPSSVSLGICYIEIRARCAKALKHNPIFIS